MPTPPIPLGAARHDTAYTLRHPTDAALEALLECALDRPSPLPLINIHRVHTAAI
jgi:hypothetical protein